MQSQDYVRAVWLMAVSCISRAASGTQLPVRHIDAPSQREIILNGFDAVYTINYLGSRHKAIRCVCSITLHWDSKEKWAMACLETNRERLMKSTETDVRTCPCTTLCSSSFKNLLSASTPPRGGMIHHPKPLGVCEKLHTEQFLSCNPLLRLPLRMCVHEWVAHSCINVTNTVL